MNNFFKTSLYVMAFALAGILFQISCSNADEAATVNNNTNDPTEKIVFVKKDFAGTQEQSIWVCDLDGSNLSQIPITLPSGMIFYKLYGSGDHSTAKLSQDGQKVLFTLQNTVAETFIYSCNFDGTDMQEVVALETNQGVFL